MSVSTLALTALLAEVVTMSTLGLVFASRRKRQRERADRAFELAATDARRMAHNALILDASLDELCELVVEQALREMGMSWSTEAI